MSNIIKNKNEMFLSMYLFIFSFIKPVLINNSDKSTLILTVTIGILIGVWLLLEMIITKTITISVKSIMFIIIIYLILFCESILRPNIMIKNFLYQFTIYGAIPILLCSKVENYKKLLEYYAAFSIINGTIYFFDPWNSYKLSGDYMNFGFCQMLPAFAGSIIVFNIFKKKYGILLMLIFFVQIFLYANKGATISSLCLILISYIFFNDKKKVVSKKFLVIGFGLIMLLLNLKTIIELLIKLIKSLNLQTYSLITFLYMLQNNGNIVYQSRTDIWKNAIQQFFQNPILGNGIGFFEANFNGYTHNFFLDIAVSSGMIGITIILIVLMICIKRVISIQGKYKKYFLIIMFVISFIPMMFSLTYWMVMPFWIYLAISLCSKKEKIFIDGEKNENINRKL